MKAAPEALSKWVKRLMADITEEGAICRFELVHTTADGGFDRVESVAIQSGESEAEDVVQMLYDSADHDAETREGKSQRYTILAFRSEQGDHESQYPFRLTKNQNAFTVADTEAPTEKGERAQMMRMSNDNHAMMLRFTESLGGRLAGELDRERKLRIDAEARADKMKLDLEDLKDRQLDRELERAARLQREKFTGDLIGSVLPLLPMALGALIEFASKKAGELPGKEKNGKTSTIAKALMQADPNRVSRTVLLKTFAENVSGREASAVAEALKPMNRIALIELFGQLQKDPGEASMVGVDAGIQKFLKALSVPEFSGALSALDPANKERFLALYKAYAEAEEKSQEELPQELKDGPPPPPPAPVDDNPAEVS